MDRVIPVRGAARRRRSRDHAAVARRGRRDAVFPRCCSILCAIAISATVSVGSGRAQEAGTDKGIDPNSANDPTTPKLTVEYWNFVAPVLNDTPTTAESGLGRLLLPFKIGGVQQLLHVTPPLTTDPFAYDNPRIGLGDTQIYNFTLTKQDVGLPEKVTFGLGPLLAVPTRTGPNLGPGQLQAGVGGVIIAPQKWGLVGVLTTYQHTVAGPPSSLTTIQPNFYYNLDDDGDYFRSSGIINVNTANHTTYVPIGLGAGRVFDLPAGLVLNVYAEAQPSLYRSGRGAPVFQVFTGFNLQFPSSVTAFLN